MNKKYFMTGLSVEPQVDANIIITNNLSLSGSLAIKTSIFADAKIFGSNIATINSFKTVTRHDTKQYDVRQYEYFIQFSKNIDNTAYFYLDLENPNEELIQGMAQMYFNKSTIDSYKIYQGFLETKLILNKNTIFVSFFLSGENSNISGDIHLNFYTKTNRNAIDINNTVSPPQIYDEVKANNLVLKDLIFIENINEAKINSVFTDASGLKFKNIFKIVSRQDTIKYGVEKYVRKYEYFLPFKRIPLNYFLYLGIYLELDLVSNSESLVQGMAQIFIDRNKADSYTYTYPNLIYQGYLTQKPETNIISVKFLYPLSGYGDIDGNIYLKFYTTQTPSQ